MVTMMPMLQFAALFTGAFWTVLFLVPLKAAHYSARGDLVVRRIFLGNLLAGLVARRVRRNGSGLVLDVEGQPAIVGGSTASTALVGLLVAPWVG